MFVNTVQGQRATGADIELSQEENWGLTSNSISIANVTGIDFAQGLKVTSSVDEQPFSEYSVSGVKSTEGTSTAIELTTEYRVDASEVAILDVEAKKDAKGYVGNQQLNVGHLTIGNVHSVEGTATGLDVADAAIDHAQIQATSDSGHGVAIYARQSKQNGINIKNASAIIGDIVAETAASKVNINFVDENAYFEGAVRASAPTSDNQISLTFDQNTVWNVTDSSQLNALTLNGGALQLAFVPKGKLKTFKKLATTTLNATDASVYMSIDIGKESGDLAALDQLNVSKQAQGTLTANLSIDSKNLDLKKLHSSNWLINQGVGSRMTITDKDGTNSYAGNGMVSTWALGFVGKGEEAKLDTTEGLMEIAGTTTGVGEGSWYLVRTDKGATDEVQQITNLGIAASQAMSFASELDDLRSRLGEVRYGAQDGLWVRAGHMKQTADGYNGRGFEQKTEDLHIGLDHLIAAHEDGSWLIGGALRYAKSDQEGFAAARGGDGELKQYSAKLYATYMHVGGSYADFVVQAGRYDQDIRGLANDRESAYSADYRTWGYGASIEAGHMFSLLEVADDRQWYNHAFIEPQVQLSYFRAHGKDFHTSTGLGVSQADADFLTGRAGVVIGKKFSLGMADDLDKRYLQIGLTGGVKYEFLGDQDIRVTGVDGASQRHKADEMDGVRYYYGVTADWQFTDDFRAYAQIEREESDNYTKDYDISVGLKYSF